MANKLLIFGGSGHAKDVISAAQSIGYERFEIVTTDGSSNISALTAVKEADFNPAHYQDWHCIAAIGNNQHRQRFYKQYAPEMRFVSIIAPEASVSDSARIGLGSYIGPFAYVGPDCTIGEACILNTHSIVGHDAKVGDFTHIGPRVCLSGHVELGTAVFVGAGAIFNNGSYEKPLLVPSDVHVGMGCQITESIRHPGIRLIPKPNHIAARD
jgi:sugar O-acyltransferase (sialic acid O-acetyltransferase NeuD family)